MRNPALCSISNAQRPHEGGPLSQHTVEREFEKDLGWDYLATILERAPERAYFVTRVMRDQHYFFLAPQPTECETQHLLLLPLENRVLAPSHSPSQAPQPPLSQRRRSRKKHVGYTTGTCLLPVVSVRVRAHTELPSHSVLRIVPVSGVVPVNIQGTKRALQGSLLKSGNTPSPCYICLSKPNPNPTHHLDLDEGLTRVRHEVLDLP